MGCWLDAKQRTDVDFLEAWEEGLAEGTNICDLVGHCVDLMVLSMISSRFGASSLTIA